MTKYVIFCDLWENMSVPDFKNLGLIRFCLMYKRSNPTKLNEMNYYNLKIAVM